MKTAETNLTLTGMRSQLVVRRVALAFAMALCARVTLAQEPDDPLLRTLATKPRLLAVNLAALGEGFPASKLKEFLAGSDYACVLDKFKSGLVYLSGEADMTGYVQSRLEGKGSKSPPPAPPGSVLVVNVERLVQKSALGKEAFSRVKERNDQNKAKAARLSTELKSMERELGDSATTEQRRSSLKKELQDKTASFKRFEDEANRELKEAQAVELKKLERQVFPVINRLGNELQAAAILNEFQSGLVYADDRCDVTDEILKAWEDPNYRAHNSCPTLPVLVLNVKKLCEGSSCPQDKEGLKEYERRVFPAIQEVAKRLGAGVVFRLSDAGILVLNESLDVTPLVRKELSASQ